MTKQCFLCRDGEHDNYDNNVELLLIIDPNKVEKVRRGNICGEHQSMMLDDGYELREIK